jgi:hypothetical protein
VTPQPTVAENDMTRRRCRFVPALLSLLCLALSAPAAEPTAEQAEFFEKKVRPILADTCQQCHGTKSAADSPSIAGCPPEGGDSGAAIVPGEPDRSRLVRAIRYDDVTRMRRAANSPTSRSPT